MPIPKTPRPSRPAKDEWGVYDPEQAGLAALFARLDAPAKPAAPEPPPIVQTPAIAERPSLRDAK